MHKLKLLLKPLALVLSLLVVFTTVFELPQLHHLWLRHKVATRVFEVRGKKDGGGGTGFQVEAPSGESYIMTNSHVCEYALKDADSKNLLLVIRGDHAIKRRVLEIDGKSDLCIIEGWPGVAGLKLGSEAAVGDIVSAVGHPQLGPTTLTSGEVTAFVPVSIVHHIMKSGDKKMDKLFGGTDEPCDQPKNEVKMQPIYFLGMIYLGDAKMCMVNETNAVATNVQILPGSSGSPLVDRFGRVVGVVFAADMKANWGFAVNFEHLQSFLKDF